MESMMPDADLVLTGGTVHTDFRSAPAAAVAVRSGRIVAVGSVDEVTALRGSRTRVVDLAGRTMAPGFIDAHVHPVWAGHALNTCDLAVASDADGALRIISEYASAHPELDWVTGSGWSMTWFERGTPSRSALDSVVPDRPAYFTNADGHGAWANSRALEAAGISSDAPDPGDGRIERLPDGTPQGTLHEGAATLVARHQRSVSAADMRAGLLRAQDHLHALGVTGWQDAIVGSYLGSESPFDTYVEAGSEGSLTARVVGALWWDRHAGEEQIDGLLGLRSRAGGVAGTGRFRATSVKIMQDGVPENFTAAMLDPYLDADGSPSGNTGLSYVEPDLLARVVTRLDAEGFQVHFHAIGDRAVRESLDAVAAARRANGANNNRHHLAHLQVVHPDDLPRFTELGVGATMQALWAAHDAQMDGLTIPFLGRERAELQYPFADLRDRGTMLAAGSDWPVSSPNPFDAAQVAATRCVIGAPDATPLIPRQRLDVPTFLRAYTFGSAWVNHVEHDTGSIAVGKLADLVILDADPLAVPPEELAGVGVLATYVGGDVVHAAPGFDA
jgi:predicted amidohydrolase YtcJ